MSPSDTEDDDDLLFDDVDPTEGFIEAMLPVLMKYKLTAQDHFGPAMGHPTPSKEQLAEKEKAARRLAGMMATVWWTLDDQGYKAFKAAMEWSATHHPKRGRPRGVTEPTKELEARFAASSKPIAEFVKSVPTPRREKVRKALERYEKRKEEEEGLPDVMR
jgi:hypothetical protein